MRKIFKKLIYLAILVVLGFIVVHIPAVQEFIEDIKALVVMVGAAIVIVAVLVITDMLEG